MNNNNKKKDAQSIVKIFNLNLCSAQGCQISWISQESPGFENFLLAKNLLISGADFRYFLLILIFFPDYLSATPLSTIRWKLSEPIRKYTYFHCSSLIVYSISISTKIIQLHPNYFPNFDYTEKS